jgi:hypothetical protein
MPTRGSSARASGTRSPSDTLARREGHRLSRSLDRYAERPREHSLGLGAGFRFAHPDAQHARANRVFQLAGRTLGDHPPFVYDGDAIGEPVRLVEVLRGQKDGRSPADMARTMAQTWLRLPGSRPVVGSSRNSRSGVTTIEAAMSSLRRMPPE